MTFFVPFYEFYIKNGQMVKFDILWGPGAKIKISQIFAPNGQKRP